MCSLLARVQRTSTRWSMKWSSAFSHTDLSGCRFSPESTHGTSAWQTTAESLPSRTNNVRILGSNLSLFFNVFCFLMFFVCLFSLLGLVCFQSSHFLLEFWWSATLTVWPVCVFFSWMLFHVCCFYICSYWQDSGEQRCVWSGLKMKLVQSEVSLSVSFLSIILKISLQCISVCS